MKTIIADSRSITDYKLVTSIIEDSGFNITEEVCGMARGVDILGLRYALERNITFKLFPVTKEDWKLKGKAAGIFRNILMGDYADALIAIWDGISFGTLHMINYSKMK